MEIIDTSCQRKFGHVHDSEDSYSIIKRVDLHLFGNHRDNYLIVMMTQ